MPDTPHHKVHRNDPCPCGSGKKYKRCCMEKTSKKEVVSYSLWAVMGLITLSIAVVFIYSLFHIEESDSPRTGNRSRVWSQEHGHWHNVGGTRQPADSDKPHPRPLGDAPPGKVWSQEHGHWHDQQ